MVDSTTPNYGWTKPTVGADSDAWGDLLNADLDSIDADLKAVSDAAFPKTGGVVAQVTVEVGPAISPGNYLVLSPTDGPATNKPQFQFVKDSSGPSWTMQLWDGTATNGTLNIKASTIAVTGAVNITGAVAATSFSGPLTGNVTGNVTGSLTGNVTGNVTGSSGSCTGNAATATTASDVSNGVVTPAKLSTGGPAWNTAGDVFLTGRLIIGGSHSANFRDDGASVSLFFASDTYLQWIPGSNQIVLVKGGSTVATW